MIKARARIMRSSTIGPLDLSGPKRVKVGFPGGKTPGDVVAIAIYQEFGTKGSGKRFVRNGISGFGGPIPERPFMRNTMRDNKGKYLDAMGKAAVAILTAAAKDGGSKALRQNLAKLGALAQADIQDSILTWTSPPNSPLTIAIKGTNAPLRDTGRMHGSVSWKIED